MTVAGVLWRVLMALQAILGLRVAIRLLRTAGSAPIRRPVGEPTWPDDVSVIVPVLNERSRLAPCLNGLLAQADDLLEILVVDGGSVDGTLSLVRQAAAADPRVRLLETSPIPEGWNGKAWGLEHGLRCADRRASWLLTIDADVRPQPGLMRAVLAQARRTGSAALSVATLQEIAGPGVGLVHPAMLATLVYRHGIPGQLSRHPSTAQANGQCMLLNRAALDGIGGFLPVAHSHCEDVTLARLFAAHGCTVGFFESEGLVSVRMYENGVETWQKWSRSLSLRDGIDDLDVLVGLLEVLLVQALPGVLLVVALAATPTLRRIVPSGLVRLNVSLLLLRIGVVVGLRRAYVQRPWTYWLSPMVDLPVALKLIQSAVRRDHHWRGRLVRREAVRGGVV